MKQIIIVFGTRPELIKLSPIIREIKRRKLEQKFSLICTNQHPDLIKDFYREFNIDVDVTLEIENRDKSIGTYINELIEKLSTYFGHRKDTVDWIVGHGDTSSCFAAAQAAFQTGIPFAHVEAGLRSYNLDQPFPEEIFRQSISGITSIHFSPTQRATENLISERITPSSIIQTGNTIVDVVKHWRVENSLQLKVAVRNKVLITCHRRESLNKGFKVLMKTVISLAEKHRNLHFIWLSHCNPFVKKQLELPELATLSNLEVRSPISIQQMFELYQETKIILTDSGGIQEEAVLFNVPTIVLREVTERPEAIEVGNAIVTGLNASRINTAFEEFLHTSNEIDSSPFGIGNSGITIVDFFENQLKVLPKIVSTQHSDQVENR